MINTNTTVRNNIAVTQNNDVAVYMKMEGSRRTATIHSSQSGATEFSVAYKKSPQSTNRIDFITIDSISRYFSPLWTYQLWLHYIT